MCRRRLPRTGSSGCPRDILARRLAPGNPDPVDRRWRNRRQPSTVVGIWPRCSRTRLLSVRSTRTVTLLRSLAFDRMLSLVKPLPWDVEIYDDRPVIAELPDLLGVPYTALGPDLERLGVQEDVVVLHGVSERWFDVLRPMRPVRLTLPLTERQGLAERPIAIDVVPELGVIGPRGWMGTPGVEITSDDETLPAIADHPLHRLAESREHRAVRSGVDIHDADVADVLQNTASDLGPMLGPIQVRIGERQLPRPGRDDDYRTNVSTGEGRSAQWLLVTLEASPASDCFLEQRDVRLQTREEELPRRS